ncbi:anhydro-N-acetylmuramic acid kinase [Candidatus Colwellia aromaticivorans]|uniref:anhydro-N-acetylmuramic acid kinase n=1 Tax=Candidatus Colwellia aromaticivorans TaxID=2267621 RepID=UPI000DF2BC16|nr:anhydro-N-acetylmuramic acid kinase [Candidatus Colwellia aromaticivorans]
MQINSAKKKSSYLGLMSGTSADGIDLALVTFDEDNKLEHHASYYQAYSDQTAAKIIALYCAENNNPNNNEIDRAFELDVELAHLFAKAISAFLVQEQLSCDDIVAIGSHGQTIRHRPRVKHPFTLQIGCCQTLATLTNIRVIGQFRRKDMAFGGQGAPLVPAFHQTIFSESVVSNSFVTESAIDQSLIKNASDVFVVNIGGIANLTFLPAMNKLNVIGYDTGTGNALMDDWFRLHNSNSHTHYDKNGDWAAKGKINDDLLRQLLSDDYFQLAPPKSTGREYFHLSWLKKQLSNIKPIRNQDVQATLTAFTAITIVNAIKQHSTDNSNITKVYLCGGGAHNNTLKNLINQQLESESQSKSNKYELLLTSQKGIDGDQLEAVAFAWLAFAYDKKLLSSMPAVTGARKSCTLGTAYFP